MGVRVIRVRVIRDGCQGNSILQRLGISEASLITLTATFEDSFSYAVGDCEHLTQHKANIGQTRMRGMANAKRLLQTG